MNIKLLKSKTFEEWCNSMETNGYSYFDLEEFESESDNPCYIAENASELDDIVSFQDMVEITESKLKELELVNEKNCKLKITPKSIVKNFLHDLNNVWVSFDTYVTDYLETL